MGGALFEGMIISEAWKAFFNCGQRPAAFFWRSHGGLEVDLIIQSQGKFWPMEIKLTSTPSVNHTKPIERFKQMAGKDTSKQGFIICNVGEKRNLPGNNVALPWFEFPEQLKRIIA